MNINNVVFERSFGVSSQLTPSTMPEIAFAGRSNVGKSSLLNKLFNRKGLAKVSQTPGKTATINFFSCDGVRFVDLPGYGYAARGMDERRSWWKLIDDYFSQDRPISYVVHLIDFRHGPLANDNELTGWLDRMEMPRIVVFTKGDKISPGKRKGQYNTIMRAGIDSILPPFVTSGVNDAEMAKLRDGIEEVLSEMIKLDAQEAR